MTHCRVLVVDDEASNRTFAEVALREAGYDVTSAPDGPEALRLVEQQQPFHLFLIDVLMPQMQGDELAARLREIDANAKILYFTGYSGLLERGKLAQQNQALIEKPVSLNDLLEAVSMMLFGHAEGMRNTT